MRRGLILIGNLQKYAGERIELAMQALLVTADAI